MSAYDKKVWTALAMHRRKPPRRASTQVTFGIGASGELTYVRVSRSSENSQVDQMAIATVRKSAPFPRPIGSPNDVESFTIQIGSRETLCSQANSGRLPTCQTSLSRCPHLR